MRKNHSSEKRWYSPTRRYPKAACPNCFTLKPQTTDHFCLPALGLKGLKWLMQRGENT